jgi:hypothetical protein
MVADISKEDIVIFNTDFSVHILDRKNSTIYHMDNTEMKSIRMKMIKKYNMLFCLHRISYSRARPQILDDFNRFYNKVLCGLFLMGNEYYSIIKAIEGYTTACILKREKHPDELFIKEMIDSCNKKIPEEYKADYQIDKLGIEEFINDYGVDIGFEVFYCQKVFGYCYVNDEAGLKQ